MFRYFALAWNVTDPLQREAAAFVLDRLKSSKVAWRSVFAQPGTEVFTAGEDSVSSQCCLLERNRGVILGRIFGKDIDTHTGIGKRLKYIDASETERILDTHSRHLVGEYWGSYVAIVPGDQLGSVSLFRSPAGALPCLTTDFQGIKLIFSLMEDCASLEIIRFSINWKYVARLTIKTNFAAETGLNEVSEVRGGELLEATREREFRTTYWNPVSVATKDVVESPLQAAEMIRQTTMMCIGTWASCHSSLLHNLSGGLDSAIIAACLKEMAPGRAVTCVTHHSPGSNSDERGFARLAARAAGYELVEHRRNASIRLEDSLNACVSERPQAYSRRLELASFETGLARDRAATAIFGGDRGDELFYANNVELAPADYILRHGIRPPLFQILVSAATLRGLSFWEILATALTSAIFERSFDPVKNGLRYHTLLNEDMKQMLATDTATRFGRAGTNHRAPPGKQYHVMSLTEPAAYYMPFDESAALERVSPLYSQPLIEGCLRIPTYVLSSGGQDRSAARRAFESDVPVEILRRRSKGGMNEHVAEILRLNGGFLRELLVGGILVQQGILDSSKVDQALTQRPSGVLKGFGKLMQLISIETWLRIWSRSRSFAGA